MSVSSFATTTSSSSTQHAPSRQWAFIETRLNENEFGRIRWSIFEPVSLAQVEAEEESPYPDASILHSHPIASLPATITPINEIAFTIMALDEHEAYDYVDDESAPDPVYVTREDGGVVTIFDVIEQLSPYLIEHKDAILEVKAPFIASTHEVVDGMNVLSIPAHDGSMPPPDTKVWFDGFFGGVDIGCHSVAVELLADGEDV